MKHLILVGTFLLFILVSYGQKKYVLKSPDESICITLSIGNDLSYQVTMDSRDIIRNSKIDIFTEVNRGTKNWEVQKSVPSTIKQVLTPIVPQKTVTIGDSCNQLSLTFTNGLILNWRVYNNGVAWQWGGNGLKKQTIYNENAEFNFSNGSHTWYPEETDFFSHNERPYIQYAMDTMQSGKLASLPALFQSNGIKVLLTESSLFRYPGMWIKSEGKNSVHAVFAQYPQKTINENDRDQRVISREDLLSKNNDLTSLPWRVLMLAREDKDLIINQLVYQLAKPNKNDYAWVKPGKVQWDWWHYNNIYNVPFRAGINNQTYKYYIDFASKNHIEYVLLDEGWSDTENLLKEQKDINIQELVEYGKSKNVSIILWMSWLTLDKQMTMALDQFKRWGVKGIKIDFMQRDDQPMVEFYEKTAVEAAKRQLLVDFHGAYKPTGWLRTFPNVMTSEGVYGNEQSKFSPTITPSHTATLPFIRMAAGPMDFTPGGMNNIIRDHFAAEPSEPMTLGTRCNQLAMFVIYESPLQMLCDIPTHYIENPECMKFLSAVPTIWKNTVPLDGKVGEYVVIAREALNNDWFIGGMTNWEKRTITLDFHYLDKNQSYKMQFWKDGPNADRNAKDYQMGEMTVNSETKISLHLAEGGGFAAHLIKL